MCAWKWDWPAFQRWTISCLTQRAVQVLLTYETKQLGLIYCLWKQRNWRFICLFSYVFPSFFVTFSALWQLIFTKHVPISFAMSVCPSVHYNNQRTATGIVMKHDSQVFDSNAVQFVIFMMAVVAMIDNISFLFCLWQHTVLAHVLSPRSMFGNTQQK
jgi:hypothetical protein